jgi:adenosine/AMP kinase
MELKLIAIQKPEEINFIFGQSHFIKTVEDIHEALVNAVPGIQFGIAFCEASGKRLIRFSGTNTEMIELAQTNALNVGTGHSFFIFLGSGFYPVNILNAIKSVPEVCQIFCATANNTRVVVAREDDQAAVLGVMDGETPLGIEGEEDIAWRKGFLRQIGYKL